MARLRFPDAASIDRVQATAGTSLLSAAGATARVYVDAAGTQLADIQNADGTANAIATLTLDSLSRLPVFLGPTSGTEVLYVRVDGGAPLEVEATLGQRFAAQDAATSAAVTAQVNASLAAKLDVTAASATYLSVALPEKYGAVGDGVARDTAALQAALATGLSVYLKPGATYLLDGELHLLPGQEFHGNGATIKRRAQFSTTTTTTITSSTTTQITVADASQMRVGQSITVVQGGTFDTSNRVITAINGNQVTVSTSFGVSFTGTSTVYLSFVTLSLHGKGTVTGLRIDGNKGNWTFNRWQNTCELETFGNNNTITDCYVENAPGEGVIVFGDYNTLRNVWLTNLNGNGVHFSAANHPVCDTVRVVNANLTPVIGHADGGIIWSNSISHATIVNCYVENAICGIGAIDSADNNDVTIANNTIVNCTGTALDLLCPGPDYPARILIYGNRIYGTVPVSINNTLSGATAGPSQIDFEGNYLGGGTTLVLVRARAVSIRGNHFDLGTNATLQALSIDGVKWVSVTGNDFTGGLYAIAVGSLSDALTISGNQFHGQNVGAVYIDDTSTAVRVDGNTIENDATAAVGYNGILLRGGQVASSNTVVLVAGRSGIYPQSGAIVKDNNVRKGGATYSIRADGGTTGILFKDNEVTDPISNGGGASNTETGTFALAA